MAGYRRGDTAFIVGVVSVAHFLSHVFLLAFPPLFPLLAVEFDLSTARLGLLVTAIYAPGLVLQLPIGELVDRIGAKWVLVTGLSVTSLSIGAAGLASSYWMLLLFAFTSGIGQSVFHPSDYALLETVTTSANEGKGFSVHTFGGFAGFAAAPLAIGSVGIAFGWEVALIGAGVVGVLIAILMALTTEAVHAARIGESSTSAGPSSGSEESTIREMASFVRRPEMVLVFLFYLFSMMALVGLQSFTTVLAVDEYGFSESAANTLLTVHLTLTAIGVLVGGPLADRASFRWVVVGLFVLGAVGVSVLVIAVPSASYVLALVLLGFVGLCFGLALPSRDTFANSVADPNAVGRSFGFFFTGLSMGAVIGPALLGLIIDLWSAREAFLVMGVILLVAASVVVIATKGSSRRNAVVSEG